MAYSVGSAASKWGAAGNYGTQQDKLHEYNDLVSTFTRIWVGLLGIMVALWFYQRFVLYRRLKLQWDADLDVAHAQWDRDLWKKDDPHTMNARGKKRLLLDLVTDGYDEIARPLERYIAVFVIFGVPAVAMATDYCSQNSGQASQDIVDCQHSCEMVS